MSQTDVTTPKKGLIAPSAGDQKFCTAIFKYLPKSMDINWEELASDLGLKNGSIARARYSQIRRKYESGEASGGSPPFKVVKATKTPKAKKGKTAGKGRGKSLGSDDEYKEKAKAKVKEEPADDTKPLVKVKEEDIASARE